MDQHSDFVAIWLVLVRPTLSLRAIFSIHKTHQYQRDSLCSWPSETQSLERTQQRPRTADSSCRSWKMVAVCFTDASTPSSRTLRATTSIVPLNPAKQSYKKLGVARFTIFMTWCLISLQRSRWMLLIYYHLA